jgi:hypothetical protein
MISYTPAAPTSAASDPARASAGTPWLLVAGERAALLVDVASAASRPTPDRVAELFAAVQPNAAHSNTVPSNTQRSNDVVRVVLDLLTVGGLSSVPSFVLASWSASGSLHLLVRGAGEVTVETATGPESINSSAVSTWVERVIVGARSVRASGAAPAASTAGGASRDAALEALPLGAGVVWASAAEMTAPDGGAALETSPATVAVVAPASVPVVEPVEEKPAVDEPKVRQSSVVEAAEPESQAVLQRISPPPVATTAAAATSTNEPVSEETVMRDVDDAHGTNAPADDAGVPATAAVAQLEGDHDGETIMSGDLVGRRAARSAGVGDVAPRVPEARAMFLVLSTGTREPLTDTVIVGRAPSVSQVSSGRVPHLVTVPGDQDISRSHAQFTLEGDTVVVTDLHSRNGTSVVLPGKAPQLLRQGEPTAVLVNTVVDLGGGITVTVTDQA